MLLGASALVQIFMGGGGAGVVRSFASGLLDMIPLAVLILFFCLLNQLMKLASILLGVFAAYWAGCSLVALIMFALHKKLNRRCVPTILLFPVFLFSWAPINLYAVLTPPPKWKVIRHTKSVDQAE